MGKLVITADVHGSLESWKVIKGLLTADDCLAVPGDLFDTVYGSPSNGDFHPDIIRREFSSLTCETHYVYGNCDHKDYLEGYGIRDEFTFEGLSILLNHGHYKLPDLTDYHIIIEGHTHIPRLDSLMGKVFLNPGSPILPRVSFASYAIIENSRIKIMHLPSHSVIDELDLNEILDRF